MDDNLKRRFIKQMIEDFISNNVQPLPTIICELDEPRITELVRRFCLFAEPMKPFNIEDNFLFVSEGLDMQWGIPDYGCLFIDVSHN